MRNQGLTPSPLHSSPIFDVLPLQTGFVSDQASPGSKLVIELSPYNITARNESMGSDDGDHLVRGLDQIRSYVFIIRPHDAPSLTLHLVIQVSLLVSYLQSYTGMGRAKIACDNGCQCKEAVSKKSQLTLSRTHSSFHCLGGRRLPRAAYFNNIHAGGRDLPLLG